MNTNSFIIYGANGFTGRLTARVAVKQGLKPILAGRNRDALAELSQELGLQFRVFGLDPVPSLEGTRLVLNCAGPFVRTAPALMQACLEQRSHYLDITGEIPVFEKAHSLSAKAQECGIVLMPGVGFDVIPTDCLALSLKEKMPTATHLEMAFFAKSPPSIGTVKTMIENIPNGGMERVDGKMIRVPLFHKTKEIQFRTRSLNCAAIPWGDLATAYYSTGIANIVVYSAHPKGFVALSKLVNPVRNWAALPLVQTVLKKLAERVIHGPTPKEQAHSTIEIWARVSGPSGSLEARIEVPEGYRFTSEVSIECVKTILDSTLKGYYTPAQAIGSQFVVNFLSKA